MPDGPIYAGDSVYADTNEFGQIELWLDNGYGRKSEIFLEQPTFEALIALAKARWGGEWWTQLKAKEDNDEQV